MYKDFKLAEVLVPLLEEYAKEALVLYNGYSAELDARKQQVDKNKPNTSQIVRSLQDVCDMHMGNYQICSRIIEEAKRIYGETRLGASLYNKKKDTILQKGILELEKLFKSDECMDILGKIAYRYYKKDKFLIAITPELDDNTIFNRSIALLQLRNNQIISDDDYILLDTLQRALPHSKSFKNEIKPTTQR